VSAPRSVFVLRRGLFGFRHSDVVGALEEQRRQIDALSAAVDSLLREKGRAWPADGERAASARLDDISAKLDRLLAEGTGPDARREAAQRQVYVSELGDLGEVRARRIARKGAV
jgi:hypothetical protein